MTVERGIAGFVLPFGAGMTAIVYIDALHSTPALLPLIIIATCVIILTHPSRASFPDFTINISIFLVALCCGMFVGISNSISATDIWYRLHFITDVAGNFREYLEQGIAEIPFRESQTGAMITALITGERHLLTSDTIEIFRESGASHILALSGLHLGIIYSILRYVLTPLGKSPISIRSRSFITISACGFYTMATGASPSIMRAFLFILIGEISVITGHFKNIGTTLMTALLFQLLLKPGSIQNPGFQLSYAAMTGIAFIYPYLKGIWPDGRGGIMKRIWNSAALSISCQLTTGPLAFIWFGTFPQYFILTNLLALPLVGLIIPAALLVLSLNMCDICPTILIQVTEQLTTWMHESLSIISTM